MLGEIVKVRVLRPIESVAILLLCKIRGRFYVPVYQVKTHFI